jgi:hypothetical protein
MKELEEKIIPLSTPRIRGLEGKLTPEMKRFLEAQQEIIKINNQLESESKLNIFSLPDPIITKSKVTGESLINSKIDQSLINFDSYSVSSDMEDDDEPLDKLSKKSTDLKDASSSPRPTPRTKRTPLKLSTKEEFGISTPKRESAGFKFSTQEEIDITKSKKEFNFDFKKETTEVQPQPKEIPQEPISKLAPFSLIEEAEKDLAVKKRNLEQSKVKIPYSPGLVKARLGVFKIAEEDLQ